MDIHQLGTGGHKVAQEAQETWDHTNKPTEKFCGKSIRAPPRTRAVNSGREDQPLLRGKVGAGAEGHTKAT